ncbi:hypothetical protein [Paenarthrobacter ilicis]|uniref:Cation transport ATPase n=1 Tax=Paenarthrobacter ilicis TaxID=43665 RepID=A0ABX0TH68_9MICC|nr:hypothetical protein [Paenarthrobacter ilicis]MBM7792469.1 cation transport ATPase [Paenarthrobacter ilicis]NIJ00813.1 cation transport ATPase [Paenarthrobacter ilicis]
MMQETADKKWFDQLILELRMRQVHGDAIGDTVASAKELLADTGQPAEEAFGPARSYAAELELPRAPHHDWIRKALWPSLLGLLAFLIFNQAVVPWVRSEPMLVSPAQAVFLAVPVVVIGLLPLYLAAALRRLWVLAVMVALCVAAGVLSGITAPTVREEAWLELDPTPWLAGTAVVMVLLSIINTVRGLGAPDDVPDPRSGTTPGSGLGSRAAMLMTNWLFPIFTLAMLGLALTFR